VSTITLELEDELVAALRELDGSLDRAARELIVLELYRRGAISGGKAGELLGLSRYDFIRHESDLGIPYFNLTDGEWEAEKASSRSL